MTYNNTLKAMWSKYMKLNKIIAKKFIDNANLTMNLMWDYTVS